MNNKELTIIMPVYNGMPFLKLAVNSILNQTYENFKFIVIDDGSTDNSYEYLTNISDSRINIIKQKNIGLCNTLNHFFNSATTKYVARLDQDDISHPTRIEEQINFLNNNHSYDCVLSLINRIGANGSNFGYYKIHDTSDYYFEYNPINHGSIANSTLMIRLEIFKKVKGYRQELYPVDDLDLLLRLSEISKIAIINKPLVDYRIHSNAFTFKYFSEMKIKTKYINYLHSQRLKGDGEISLEEFQRLFNITNELSLKDYGELYFRTAGSCFGTKKIITGIMYLLAAVFCNPQNSINRLKNLKR